MKILSSLAFFSYVVVACGQKPAVFSTKDGAIKGYDPVAYFTEQKPVKGEQSISYEWEGATWYFTSEANKKLFTKNPEKYAPQYGGYCAFGVAKGGLYKIEPEAWKIVEGKLYLNYSLKLQKDWEADIPGYLEKANENWPELIKNN